MTTLSQLERLKWVMIGAQKWNIILSFEVPTPRSIKIAVGMSYREACYINTDVSKDSDGSGETVAVSKVMTASSLFRPIYQTTWRHVS